MEEKPCDRCRFNDGDVLNILGLCVYCSRAYKDEVDQRLHEDLYEENI